MKKTFHATQHGRVESELRVAEFLERQRRTEELAAEVLALSRNSLMVHLRFLGAAFIQFRPSAGGFTRSLATDGQHLYFDALHVIRSYRREPGAPLRDYLHVTLHCVFRHLFVGRSVDPAAWDLACDVAVENVIAGLGLEAASCVRAERQAGVLAALKEEVRPLSAEKLYRYFRSQELPKGELERLRLDFLADEHELWREEAKEGGDSEPRVRSEKGESGEGESESGSVEGNEEEESAPIDEGVEESSEDSVKAQGGDSDSGGGPGSAGERDDDRRGLTPNLAPEELERRWKEISERIQVDLDTSSSTWGQSAGDMIQELREVNRERYDYSSFLKRFAVLGENIEVNDDEFDYIFYTYGLRMYENMPLVEPLEYKETKRIREFVIALDTSESVAGDLVQKFVTKTYNILKQSESFFTRTNIHIMQCGAQVMEDAKIASAEDFDRYLATMRLVGFGGTDFRPVFERVDEMLARRELTDFKGLVYFTDGHGAFPERKPGYDAAFVFVGDEGDVPELPVWAIKLVLSPEEIELF
jgi:predicted metal-dependent peptidase